MTAAAPPRYSLVPELTRLRERNAELENEVFMLKRQLGQAADGATLRQYRKRFSISHKESVLLHALMVMKAPSKEQLYEALIEGAPDGPELKIVDVVICHLRRKLQPHGVTIETQWGHGYYVTDENKAVVGAILHTGEVAA